MPRQALDCAPGARFAPTGWRTRAARLLCFGGAVAATVLGAEQMFRVFGNEVTTTLQLLLLGLFTVTFGWIAFSALQAVAGLFFCPRPAGRAPEGPLGCRTVLAMPVYNEDPAATGAALWAMGDALASAGHGDAFEIFLLSDTRDADAWVAETAAYAALRERLAGRVAVWYRRRPSNIGRKAGNLEEFVRRWGGRYDYMLVLDADSLMAPETVVEMVRRMRAAPRLGILQSVPQLAFGDTLFARLQQFASAVYGPVVARGVAAWQGLDGNYWGHNALIRVRAFAGSCALPELDGRAPFGGHVLSHDFVEAAFIRRAGWEVRMDPDLGGSWEGSPPSLIDVAARDRRWAQGNLQHGKVIAARGLRWPNRAHFAIGIAAYLMSPVWLLMIAVGMLLTGQTLFLEPSYFEGERQLFPDWPVFDAERMGWLFLVSIAMLLLPKLIGWARVLASRGPRRAFGGGWRLSAGVLVEILLSALFAPVLMLMQARQVLQIFAGIEGGWSAQRRTGTTLPWREAIGRHWWHVLAGVGPGVLLLQFAPDQLLWLSPVLVGLALAPLLSRLSGAPRVGRISRRAGLLLIGDEIAPPRIFHARASGRAGFADAAAVGLADLATAPRLRAVHGACLDPAAGRGPEGIDIDEVTARAKLGVAADAEAALALMTPAERCAIAGAPELLERLAAANGTQSG